MVQTSTHRQSIAKSKRYSTASVATSGSGSGGRRRSDRSSMGYVENTLDSARHLTGLRSDSTEWGYWNGLSAVETKRLCSVPSRNGRKACTCGALENIHEVGKGMQDLGNNK